MRGLVSYIASRRVLLVVCTLLATLACAFPVTTTAYAAETGSKCQQTTSGGTGASGVEGAGSVKLILDTFKTGSGYWAGVLSGYAKNLFWLLVSIELAWVAITMALRGDNLDDWLREITSQIFVIGFFAFLLFQASNLFPAIINSFEQAALTAAGDGCTPGAAEGKIAGIDPVAVFNQGIALAWRLWELQEHHFTMMSVVILFCALTVAVTVSLLAASALFALIESYIVMNAAILFMGFGGSSWTREYPRKIMRLAVGVGAKLFIMQLLVLVAFGVLTKFTIVDITTCKPSTVSADQRPSGEEMSRRMAEQESARRGLSFKSANFNDIKNGLGALGWIVAEKAGLEKWAGLCQLDASVVTRALVLAATCLILWLLVQNLPNLVLGMLTGTPPGASSTDIDVRSAVSMAGDVSKLAGVAPMDWGGLARGSGALKFMQGIGNRESRETAPGGMAPWTHFAPEMSASVGRRLGGGSPLKPGMPQRKDGEAKDASTASNERGKLDDKPTDNA